MYKFDFQNHIHLIDDKPLIGTTTALKVLAKPLTWWAAGMAVGKLGWINSKVKVAGRYQEVPLQARLEAVRGQFEAIKGMTIEGYIALLDQAYRAHDEYKNERAETGTDRHSLLEDYVKKCISTNQGIPLAHDPQEEYGVSQFKDWAKKNIKKFLWSEAYVYSTELWTGGIADVGWIDMEDRIIAGDFKSSKDAYFDQFLQVAGYDLMLSENGGHDSEGKKIFKLPGPIQGYCVIPFGQKELEPKIIYDTNSYKEGFKSTVHLYKLNQSYE